MGTLFTHPALLEKYIRRGMEQRYPSCSPPVTIPDETNHPFNEQTMAFLKATGEKLWASGLPVIDDLHKLWLEAPGRNEDQGGSAQI